MTPEAFCYWLQGHVELGGAPPTAEQWEVIKDHLKLVFTKVTPDRQTPRPPFVPPKTSPFDIKPITWPQPGDDQIFRSPDWPTTTIIC